MGQLRAKKAKMSFSLLATLYSLLKDIGWQGRVKKGENGWFAHKPESEKYQINQPKGG